MVHIPREPKKYLPVSLTDCEIKSVWAIFETEVLIYLSKANLGWTFFLVKSRIFQTEKLENFL